MNLTDSVNVVGKTGEFLFEIQL